MAIDHDLTGWTIRARERTSEVVRVFHSATTTVIVTRLKSLTRRIRSRHLGVLDIAGSTAAVLIAMSLWVTSVPGVDSIGPYLWIAGIIVATRIAVNIVLGLYRHSWRYASTGDMGQIIKCLVAGSIVSLGIVVGAVTVGPTITAGVPSASFWLTEMSLALAAIAVPRFTIRAASDLRSASEAGDPAKAERTLLYGAGWAGVMVARSAERDPDTSVVPVGFLDDDVDLKGRRVAGLRVFGGSHAMASAKRATGATSLLITMPAASGDTVRVVVEAAMALGLEVRTVPPMTDLLDGTLDGRRFRRVNVEDLLRRPISRNHAPAVSDLMRGKTVLITGAAGSIGSELARQVLAVGPSHIALVDQAESPLYLCLRDIEARVHARSKDKPSISSHLLDVTDRGAMRRLMAEIKPSVVFHAAAYKHVPVLEQHAAQAIRVNIGGTMAVVDAAVAADVEHFVFVSTDKAVWPSSVMGASKRAAEMVVADAARRTGKAYIAVRFGNVLGSNGSVIPIFQEQLDSGKPLTITDPDMTRYFMTIPEAAWLILDASAIAQTGGLFVLDMGEPIRIMDIADDLIWLSGREPGSVPIEIVGLRTGEKLHEELFYDQEHAHPTEVEKVLRAQSQEPPELVRDDMTRLLVMAGENRQDDLRRDLHAYVRTSVQAEEGTWAATSGNAKPAGQPLADLRPVVAIRVESNGHAAPSNGHAAPSNGHAAPSNGHAAPSNGHAAPSDHSEAVAPEVK